MRQKTKILARSIGGVLCALICAIAISGCAIVHHVAIGDIEDHPAYVKKPFDIKVSETGINLQEAAKTARLFMRKNQGKEAENIAAIIGLFQMGPHTGNGVYVKDYAKNLVEVIYEKCPSGRVTGLVSIRETRKYPIVSGEIVKVTGYCLIPKEG
jgi:hypothetical protein